MHRRRVTVTLPHHCRVSIPAEGTPTVLFKLCWLYVLDWCGGGIVVFEAVNVLMTVLVVNVNIEYDKLHTNTGPLLPDAVLKSSN